MNIKIKWCDQLQENTADEDRTSPMRENTYVRIFGHVRAFGGKKSVVAFKMVPILDWNELTTHLLEVIHSHMSLTRGQVSTLICNITN